MAHNDLDPAKLPKAEANSKKGWLTFTGQVPPEVGDVLLSIIGRGRRQTDVVCEALTKYVARKRAA